MGVPSNCRNLYQVLTQDLAWPSTCRTWTFDVSSRTCASGTGRPRFINSFMTDRCIDINIPINHGWRRWTILQQPVLVLLAHGSWFLSHRVTVARNLLCKCFPLVLEYAVEKRALCPSLLRWCSRNDERQLAENNHPKSSHTHHTRGHLDV